MSKISLTQLSQENKILRKNKNLFPINVLIVSNVTVDSSEKVITNCLLHSGFDPTIKFGNYDNIVSDSANAREFDFTLIIWELANIIEDFMFKVFSLSSTDIMELISRIKSQIDITYGNLSESSMVIVTKFSVKHFYASSLAIQPLEEIVRSLNNYLEEKRPSSVQLIDIDNIFLRSGLDAIDFKLYNLFKSLYTTNFYYHLGKMIIPIIKINHGRVKKVLILDCDNTLWKGIIGEDGMDEIQMSSNDKKGAHYARVQYLIKGLFQKGVLMALCSKNNFDDVKEVFDNHPDMNLSFDQFVAYKINWQSKAENIKEIARDLNLGLDSFVFVDDSDFEVNLIKEELPEVKVYQVPKKSYQYPKMFIGLLNEFYNPHITHEDLKKTEAYKQEVGRKTLQSNAKSHEGYMESLGLELFVEFNSLKDKERLAQMTQKTNQFNFTTKRYTISDVENFIKNPDFTVISFSVLDRFGDYGITALAILDLRDAKVLIDTFLMSCRIIGRDLELAIVDVIIDYLMSIGHETVQLDLIHTKKNIVVKEFGEKFSFQLVEETDKYKSYHQKLSKYQSFNLPYIKVHSANSVA